MSIPALQALDPNRFERADVLKRLNAATRALAELKGVAASIPNQNILINTLTLREAQDSSAIENIVTTQDDLYREDDPATATGMAVKEVLRYRQALKAGFAQTRNQWLDDAEHHPEHPAATAGMQSRRIAQVARNRVARWSDRLVYEPPQVGGGHPDGRTWRPSSMMSWRSPADPLAKMVTDPPPVRASNPSTMAMAAPDASSMSCIW